ncbi:MAG: M23 family metallopeptidase [Anaerolineaceae bacterium]|nr:M23 family metallopeptidase [Anaerolineaceae bacterium]
MHSLKIGFLFALAVIILLAGYFILRGIFRPARYLRVVEWIRNPEKHPEWAITALDSCKNAPFQFPTDGYIGFIWGDSFRPGHKHQGLDIFCGKESGSTPIYAAYSGYLTRLPSWKSSIIIRIPSDPLNPADQIWTYYTHMADEYGNSYIDDNFPPGTSELFVKAGTLLGYQGNYSGTPGNPTGIHLHFSIVKDDGRGWFLNELDFKNTIDPSPYFKLNLNANSNKDTIPICGYGDD